LFGYLCFGLFFAILEEKITNKSIDLAMGISLMILSLVLISSVLEVIKKRKNPVRLFL